VKLSPLGTSATNWHMYKFRMMIKWSSRWNENWQGKPKYSEKPAPVPLYLPQIPHDLIWVRNRAAVGSRRLTARAMARLQKASFLRFLFRNCHQGFGQLRGRRPGYQEFRGNLELLTCGVEATRPHYVVTPLSLTRGRNFGTGWTVMYT
jgi:hypothetical protein